MKPETLLDFMHVTERLKCNVRHSRTTDGRRESVAEHTYRLCVFAWLVKDEFPECDMDKVMKMCLFHDLGEAVTGDIPAFVKTDDDRKVEGHAISSVTAMLPEKEQKELEQLFQELDEARTMEAKIVHALDKMEALIQHNEADIETWLPLEYELQMTYGQKECKAAPYLEKLREVIRQDSVNKVKEEGEDLDKPYYVRKGIENMKTADVIRLLRSTDWAKDRSEEEIKRSMENSCPYGLFLKEGRQIGFARIITDQVTSFYLMDLVIDKACRRQGYGTILMNQIMADAGQLYGMLHTENAETFYEKYGFHKIQNINETGEIYMEKPCGAYKKV